MSEQDNMKMTPKAPLMVLGVVLAILGILVAHRKGRWALAGGGVLAAVGIAVFIWSASLANWCAPDNQKFGLMVWGAGITSDTPTLSQCVRMVFGR